MTLPKLNLQPDAGKHAAQWGNEVLSTPVNNGPTRTRRDFDGMPATVPIQFVCDESEYQYLCAFYRARAGHGTLPFLIDLFVDQANWLEYEAKFVAGTFALASKMGDAYIVTAQLEVQKSPDDDEGDEAYLVLFDNFGPDSEAILFSLDHLVTVIMPEAFG
jgi:hypothetical protein